MRKITAEMLNTVLSDNFNEENYPKDKDSPIRKFSIEAKLAVQNSEECLFTCAAILSQTGNNLAAAVATALSTGIVLGYITKEAQIEKIIDNVEKS